MCHFLELPLRSDAPTVANVVAALKINAQWGIPFSKLHHERRGRPPHSLGDTRRGFRLISLSVFFILFARPIRHFTTPKSFPEWRPSRLSPDGGQSLNRGTWNTRRGQACYTLLYQEKPPERLHTVHTLLLFTRGIQRKEAFPGTFHLAMNSFARRTGGEDPPGYSAQNVNTMIKAVLGKLGIPSHRIYSPHGFPKRDIPRIKAYRIISADRRWGSWAALPSFSRLRGCRV